MKTLDEIQNHQIKICQALSRNACAGLNDDQVSQVAGEFIKLTAITKRIINETYVAGQQSAIERVKTLGKTYGGQK